MRRFEYMRTDANAAEESTDHVNGYDMDDEYRRRFEPTPFRALALVRDASGYGYVRDGNDRAVAKVALDDTWELTGIFGDFMYWKREKLCRRHHECLRNEDIARCCLLDQEVKTETETETESEKREPHEHA